MRMTVRTNLAMRTLMFCAVNPGRVVRRQEVAVACNVSENHLAQVRHLLAQQKFLHTIRGRAGGLQLGRAPESITVGQVFRALEAPLPFVDCFDGGENTCPLRAVCRLKCLLSEAVEAFYATLDRMTVQDLVEKNDALQHLLKVA